MSALLRTICFFIFSIPIAMAQPVTKKVLFIGDSYVSVNNLPQLVHDAALSVGDTLIFDSNTPGGYKLVQHFTNTTSKSKIMGGSWDYVVLQEQSQTPCLENDNFFQGSYNLCKFIKQYHPCAEPLFYMTWGRKNGDALNCPVLPHMCTYSGMDTTLRNMYLFVAQYNNSPVSPVGAVWRHIRQHLPAIELYTADNSHPSLAGSYAAACCFYSVIFQKDPTAIIFNPGLSAIEATNIRSAVKTVVYDSLFYWDLKKPPVSDFEFEMGAGVNEVLFESREKHIDNRLWEFGDGTTSTVPNPAHSYAVDGTYMVTFTTSNCNLLGSFTSVTDTAISFCSHNPTITRPYPWPCGIHSDTLWTQSYDTYQWYSGYTSLPGETNQYLIDHHLKGTDFFVLAGNAGCSEFSPHFSLGLPGFLPYYEEWIGSPCAGSRTLVVRGLTGIELIQWNKDGVPIPAATNDSLFVNATGSYTVSLFHDNCIAEAFYTSMVYTYSVCVVGIETGNTTPSMQVFPNPSRVFTVYADKILLGEYYSILDVAGCVVSTGKLDAEQTHLNMDGLSAGVYYFKCANRFIKLIRT